jgi:hypothetical protein
VKAPILERGRSSVDRHDAWPSFSAVPSVVRTITPGGILGLERRLRIDARTHAAKERLGRRVHIAGCTSNPSAP